MKRYALHITLILVALMAVSEVWGQINISGTWGGGALTGDYKLIGNTKLTEQISVSSGTLTIDLNGYELDRENKGFVAVVAESRTLVIKDSRGGGIITGGRGDRGGCMLISGTVKFQGGEITNCISYDDTYGNEPKEANPDQHYLTQGCGGAFFVNSGATLEMSGNAKISNCKTEKLDGTFGRGGAVWVAGTFKMTSGTISGCQATYGGAVFVHGGYKNTYAFGKDSRLGTFLMSGGTITSCMAYDNGPGVYTYGNVEISGNSVITENKPLNWKDKFELIDNIYPKVLKTGGHGGAIYAEGEKAIVSMTSGTLSKNLAESGGAVMLWTGSTMTMTGGTMDGNYAMGEPSLGNGGAVYVQGATFNFNGGTLSNNTANRYGGAININQGSTLVLGGNCIIEGNKASHGGGISQEAGECSLSLTNDGINIYKNEAHGHQVNLSDQGVYTVANADGNGGGLFIEKGTVTISAGKISGNIASGHGGGAALYVKRIHGEKTTVNITGGEISGNKAKLGGGIDLYADYQKTTDDKGNELGKSQLVVNFESGTLKDNKASENGAGIYVSFNEQYSTAKMTIGTSSSTPIVSGNIAENNGGGFGMANNGDITVHNIDASGNQAANGGAIWVNNGSFTMNDGIFSSNKALNKGGGVYLGGGTFTVPVNAEASFKDNEATEEGGGLYCAATFTINGTITIQNNEAKNGAGVTVDGGSVTLTEGIIENNTATQYGGGLYVIGDNNASFYGGIIRYNKAKAGGGVFASGKKILTLASDVIENEAIIGGGIYMENGVDMRFGDGLIVSNSAKAETETSLGTAYGKNANSTDLYGVGGGIFMADGADANHPTKLSFTNVTSLGIYNNDATYAGADVCANGINTFIVLPNPKTMDMTDFSTIGNELYWVEDYVTGDSKYSEGINQNPSQGGIRYVDALSNTEKSISRLLFDEGANTREIKCYACLDLGYDLVFITLLTSDLDLDEYAAIQVLYKNESSAVPYHKVYFNGVKKGDVISQVIGLPSGDWKFEATDWMTEKYDKPSFNPVHNEDGFINIKREGLNGANDQKTEITLTFTELTDNKQKNIIEAHKRIVNYMK